MSGKQGGGEQGTGAGAEQLNSDLASSMRDQAEALAKAAANKDIKSALPIAFMLIGAAAPLGHPQLGGIASSLVDAASSNQPMSRQLQVLNELARQLQSVFGRR
jgi:HPt (histidine-containing phosphotransfer) domain-containing protein